jgi:hypothetical protein
MATVGIQHGLIFFVAVIVDGAVSSEARTAICTR